MGDVFVGAGLVSGALLCATVLLIWRLVSSMSVQGVDPEWLKSFSMSSYRPMERLLNQEDLVFLRAQRGFEPKIEKELRASRCRLFRMFLKDLGRDFNRLHYALRLMVLYAPSDCPELAKTLLVQKFSFFVALVTVRVRLELYALGFGPADVRGLISAVDGMRAELQRMMQPAQVSAASA
jgi:hypothetical protein